MYHDNKEIQTATLPGTAECFGLVERCPMRHQAPPRRKGGVGERGKCRHYRR
jgi:hypothetical protein